MDTTTDQKWVIQKFKNLFWQVQSCWDLLKMFIQFLLAEPLSFWSSVRSFLLSCTSSPAPTLLPPPPTYGGQPSNRTLRARCFYPWPDLGGLPSALHFILTCRLKCVYVCAFLNDVQFEFLQICRIIPANREQLVTVMTDFIPNVVRLISRI